MDCERNADEQLQADKMDLLYGEADAAVRARVEAHLATCAACRDELRAFSALRPTLAAWRLPALRPAFTPRGIVVPRWLAAAAALLLGVSLSLSASTYVSLRRALAAQEARAAELEARQRQAAVALEQALAQARPAASADALLARFDARLDARLRDIEQRQTRQLDVRLADWSTRAEAQRRVDLARVAEGLSYLDGRHGQQLARTNELMGYVLETAALKR
jgi:anti-sigma factor RsiW